MFLEYIFTELLLMAASVSTHNLVLAIINYTFDFCSNAGISLPLVSSLENFYDGIVKSQ